MNTKNTALVILLAVVAAVASFYLLKGITQAVIAAIVVGGIAYVIVNHTAGSKVSLPDKKDIKGFKVSLPDKKDIKGFKRVKSCTSKNVLNMENVVKKTKVKMGDPCLAIEAKDGKLYGLGPLPDNVGGKDSKGKPILGGSVCNTACGAAAVSGQIACAALVFDEPECGIGVASAQVACNAACK
jgi:hypothetical protein